MTGYSPNLQRLAGTVAPEYRDATHNISPPRSGLRSRLAKRKVADHRWHVFGASKINDVRPRVESILNQTASMPFGQGLQIRNRIDADDGRMAGIVSVPVDDFEPLVAIQQRLVQSRVYFIPCQVPVFPGMGYVRDVQVIPENR